MYSLGIGPADDLVLEGEAGAVLVGRHLDDHVAVLAAAAGLADETTLGLEHHLGDALAVGHLRPAHVGVHAELAQQPVDDDLQMQFAHAGDDGLPGLLVGAHAEGRVLVGQLHEALAQTVLVDLGLGLDGHEDDRLGELDGLEHDGAALVAEGVARGRDLEAHSRRDVAGEHLGDVFAVVGVHLQDAADPLLLVLVGVVDVRARFERARVHPEVRELAHEGVGHDLESDGRERLVVVGRPGDRLRRSWG